MKKVIYIILLHLLCICSNIFSQKQNFSRKTMSELINPCPDKTAIGRYGNVLVDLYSISSYKEMIDRDAITSIFEISKKRNSSKHLFFVNYAIFQFSSGNLLLPQSEQISLNGVNNLRNTVEYSKCNFVSSLIKHPATDDILTLILWKCNNQYPIAEIKNATYEQVRAALEFTSDTEIDALSEVAAPDVNSIRTKLDNYLKNTTVTVTSYTYRPLVGMLTATDPRGVTTYYDYDDFNRLKRTYIIENGVQKTVQSYDYHYQGQ